MLCSSRSKSTGAFRHCLFNVSYELRDQEMQREQTVTLPVAAVTLSVTAVTLPVAAVTLSVTAVTLPVAGV